MRITYHEELLWPTRVGFFELGCGITKDLELLYNYSLECINHDSDNMLNAEERRVHNILNIGTSYSENILSTVIQCAKYYVGEELYNKMSPVSIENRSVILEDRSFINTHVDSREGHITAVLWLTGNGGSHNPEGNGEGINTPNGNPIFKLEDPSRYFDEHRLPWETRHSFMINPKAGLLCFFPSHLPHNGHPYKGDKYHIQIPIGFTFANPIDVEEEPGVKINAVDLRSVIKI